MYPILMAQVPPVPTPIPNSGTILRELDTLSQTVNSIGTTNALIVLAILVVVVFWRVSAGKTSSGALMQQLIITIGEQTKQVGNYATSIDTLTKQLINESNKGIEQRDKLIDVLNASQAVHVTMDQNLVILGKGMETNRLQVDAHYSQLNQRLLEVITSDKIMKGEVDIMRRFDEKLNTDIEAIKQELGEIKKLLTERAEIDTAEKKKLTDALSKMQTEITQLAAIMKSDAGEHPAVETPPTEDTPKE